MKSTYYYNEYRKFESHMFEWKMRLKLTVIILWIIDTHVIYFRQNWTIFYYLRMITIIIINILCRLNIKFERFETDVRELKINHLGFYFSAEVMFFSSIYFLSIVIKRVESVIIVKSVITNIHNKSSNNMHKLKYWCDFSIKNKHNLTLLIYIL